jgi:hypothetical protein
MKPESSLLFGIASGCQQDQLSSFQMESCAMSDHNLQFKGPRFYFNVKGWQALVAAVTIVGMIVWWLR